MLNLSLFLECVIVNHPNHILSILSDPEVDLAYEQKPGK